MRTRCANVCGVRSTSDRITVSSRSRAPNIDRGRVEANAWLMADYFCDYLTYTNEMFKRRFRMRKDLFLRIVDDLSTRYPYFQQQTDALGNPGFSPIQKCTAAIRQMAYGISGDAFDEYVRMGEKTSRDCLNNFCMTIIEVYGQLYLRKLSYQDIQQLYAAHKALHGFLGMLGSLDCMHWDWGKCTVAWQGQFKRGDHPYPTIIVEAVASLDTWIWHTFFGCAGAMKDLNVLGFGIYPEWATSVKSFSFPEDVKRVKFKKAQDAAHLVVSEAFEESYQIKSRWSIPQQGYKLPNAFAHCSCPLRRISEDELSHSPQRLCKNFTTSSCKLHITSATISSDNLNAIYKGFGGRGTEKYGKRRENVKNAQSQSSSLLAIAEIQVWHHQVHQFRNPGFDLITTELLEPFEEPEREFRKRNKNKSKANKVHPRALIFDMGDEAPMWTARRAAPTVSTNPITKPDLNKEIPGKLLHMIKDLTFDEKNDSNPIVHMENFVDICDLFKTEEGRDDAIRLRVFPLTLTGEARAWLRLLEPSSITTWEGLRSKFLSRFFPPSKIDKLRAEIRSFQQDDGETISEAWERFKHLLNSCPSHELSKSEQVQTFYSGLAYSSRATLDSSAGGVFMYKTPTEGYKLLEDMLIHNIDWRTDKRLQIPRMAGKISTNFDPSDELASMKN
ncbi:hypothetical protein OSB04_016511 [Centaurea solstitialis]|uniref:Retrotransposon gag domain-containing protein n=1 Tax=Centaurea solstitialis TaxID=347529 RepID=A0AA38TEB7_9ASTR|nr:hypothetical protein OSB04_016511 [Centaurea solstitialis]